MCNLAEIKQTYNSMRHLSLFVESETANPSLFAIGKQILCTQSSTLLESIIFISFMGVKVNISLLFKSFNGEWENEYFFSNNIFKPMLLYQVCFDLKNMLSSDTIW